MKLKVTGVETIEVTNPKGLRALPVNILVPPQTQQQPTQPIIPPWHIPPFPGTSGPLTIPVQNPPYTPYGAKHPDHEPHIWSKKIGPTAPHQYTAQSAGGESYVMGLSASFRNDLKAVMEGKGHNGNDDI